MHYVQVNKNYFQKVYANGKKKRISRNEYLEKNTQKGGDDQIQIEYDSKTYNYQMGATNKEVKTYTCNKWNEPILKSDFVKNAIININGKNFPLCKKKDQSDSCESKGLFGTDSLISRKSNRDYNYYNTYIIWNGINYIKDWAVKQGMNFTPNNANQNTLSLTQNIATQNNAYPNIAPPNNTTPNNAGQSGGMTTGAEIGTIIGFVIYIVACVLLPKTGEGKFWCIFWFFWLLTQFSSSSGGSENKLPKKNLTKEEKNKIANDIKNQNIKIL